MLVSYKWLLELCPSLRADGVSVEQVAERLTEAGLEIEGQKRYGHLPGVVIAEVRAKRPHPERDKLNLVTLNDGRGEIEVVCGANNVPEPGGRVLFAREGAELPGGMKIGARKLGGIESRGMICSEIELDIGSEEGAGIFIVDPALDVPLGTEVSEALDLEDWVLEVGLTPNRPDCLGHLGTARELSALFRCALTPPAVHAPASLLAAPEPPKDARPMPLFDGKPSGDVAPQVPIVVQDAKRCPRYAAAVVRDVRVGPSPFWLRYRLHVLGLRSISNVVDVTNLVLMEYGYPTHAFDLEQLRGPEIQVRVGREGEKAVTLDGEEHTVGPDDLLICDAEGAVAVAGVMGGERSGVSESTRHVLVECAYFDPRGIRRTSRRLGLHTDSSHRFERGVDPRAVPAVLQRVCGLLAEVASGVPCMQGAQVYPEAIAPRNIALRGSRIEALLGKAIARDEARRILEDLGCTVQLGEGDSLEVEAPTWRPDLGREEDLVEEVARIHGYDNLPTETPRARSSAEGTAKLVRFVRQTKTRAAQAGLTEVVNYAFVSAAQLAAARVPTDAVRLANPLSEERSVMRTSLLPGLLANVGRAQRHLVERATVFELARTFAPTGGPLPVETLRFGLMLYGPQARWIGPGEPMDFFDGKGMLEAVLKPITGYLPETKVDAELGDAVPYLHPRRCARVTLAGRDVGHLGELHPDVLDAFELTGPVVYADIDVAAVFAAAQSEGAVQVLPVPRFPASLRDLAVEVDESVEAGEVLSVLREAGGALLESAELFDLYRGEQVGEGKKSLAFRLVYRDPAETLTDKRVDKAHAQLVKAAQQRFGAALRA